jgi:hypothetical protein
MNTPINGHKTVAVAGTAEPIMTTNQYGYLIIKALASNTNDVYVGNSTVDSTNGYPLEAGESVAVALDGLQNVYLDAAVNGEGVAFIGVV